MKAIGASIVLTVVFDAEKMEHTYLTELCPLTLPALTKLSPVFQDMCARLFRPFAKFLSIDLREVKYYGRRKECYKAQKIIFLLLK